MTKFPAALYLTLLALGIPMMGSAAGPEGGGTNVDVVLVVNGKKKADTWVNVSENGSLIEIPGPPVFLALIPLIPSALITRIEGQMGPAGTITNKVLARYGIDLAFNRQKSQVTLGMSKANPPPSPAPAPAVKTDTGAVPKEERIAGSAAKAKDTSGPWTTPPLAAVQNGNGGSEPEKIQVAPMTLPGPAPAKRIPAKDTARDNGWEPLKGDSMVAKTEPPFPAAAKPAKEEPKSSELQTYQLDRSRDELFEDVFKHKPPPLPPSVEVTLLVDGKSFGTLWILYSPELKKYTFPVDPVLNALQGLIKHELWEKLERRASAQSRFTVEDLIDCGFPTVLNTSVFELSTGLPAQSLGSKLLPLSALPVDPYTVPAYEPAGFSAFLNMRLRERFPYYQYNPGPYDSTGFGRSIVDSRNKNPREPLTVDLDGAINHKAWVLEGKAVLLEQRDQYSADLHRSDIRLIHDWPRSSVRLTAGDLIFPTTGFQSFTKMGGIGLSRDFSLQPHLAAYPVKDFEFFLSNPSEVKIYINGTLKGTYQLDPGTHDIKGFPFTNGESEVEIRITDYTGQTQTLNFNFIQETSLLAEGRSVFSYNIGLPSQDVYKQTLPDEGGDKAEIMNYEYDLDHPSLYLEYKRGISDVLTAEAYSQVQDTAGIAGTSALRAFRWGKIKADAAGSYHIDDGFSWAGSVEYTFIPKMIRYTSPMSWRLRTEHIGERFFRPGQDKSLLGATTITGSLQKDIEFAVMNLAASYTFRPDSTDFYNLLLSFNKSWGRGWATSFSLKNTFDRQRSTNTNVNLTLDYYFNLEKNSVSASERVDNHKATLLDKGTPPNWDYTTDVDWDYNVAAPFPANPSLRAVTSFGPEGNNYSGMAKWQGNEGYAQIDGERDEPKLSSLITNHADATLQTSLVYVDGNFAFSRPITNSFVMVKGIDNEKSNDIVVNANDYGYDAQATKWMPGVISNVNPYSLKKVHIDVIDPPIGANDERTDYTIYPGYKSGYALYMGTKSTIIALGTLMLDSGKPAEYQTFQAVALDGEKRDPVVGFTNGAGKFQLTRLQPGAYRIEMDIQGRPCSALLTLPKDAEGIKAVGVLSLVPN